MEPHNKIINDVAKRILKPEGLFRIGSTRSWFEDNGYYFTIVEFQSSSLEKGSYLNVGIDFLWETNKDMNAYLKYDVGGRVIVGKGTQFVEYRPRLKDCDSIFEKGIEEFADAALQKVIEYRKYSDLDYAQNMLIKAVDETSEEVQFWELYRLSMLCFFKGDYEEGKRYFYDFLSLVKNSFYKSVRVVSGETEKVETIYIEWHEKFYNYCLNHIVPQITSCDMAQKMVFEMINLRRAIFSNKASYRNMRKDVFYGVNSDLSQEHFGIRGE